MTLTLNLFSFPEDEYVHVYSVNFLPTPASRRDEILTSVVQNEIIFTVGFFFTYSVIIVGKAFSTSKFESIYARYERLISPQNIGYGKINNDLSYASQWSSSGRTLLLWDAII